MTTPEERAILSGVLLQAYLASSMMYLLDCVIAKVRTLKILQ
jgi:hypothetical protein